MEQTACRRCPYRLSTHASRAPHCFRGLPPSMRQPALPISVFSWYTLLLLAVQVFMPSNQGQLGAEGFIMGSMYLCFGLSVAALTFAVPKLASESSRRYAAYACIFSAAMLFRQIVSLYTWKTGKHLSQHICKENSALSKLMLLYVCVAWSQIIPPACRVPMAHILLRMTPAQRICAKHLWNTAALPERTCSYMATMLEILGIHAVMPRLKGP